MKILLFACIYKFMSKSYFWEKSDFWDIGQNALSQSHCRIFKSSFSPEQIDIAASFLACWYKFTRIKNWLWLFWLVIVKSGYGQSGVWTIKITISREWNNGINWFYACWCKFVVIKRWLEMLGVGMVKNECGQSGQGTIDCISKNTWNKLGFFMLVQIQAI